MLKRNVCRLLCLVLDSSIQTQAQDEITCFRISETWRKHATTCFRYVYVKVVRFCCIRSNGNARKRHETGNGNTGYPSCFRNGLTCFCHVSVYGFLQFRPVKMCNGSVVLLMLRYRQRGFIRSIEHKREKIL